MKKITVNWSKVFGVILLTPPIISVFLFVIALFGVNLTFHAFNFNSFWAGKIDYADNSGGGGYSSPVPLYLGLLAIAGGYLFKSGAK